MQAIVTLGIYIHIPFCESSSYCHFVSMPMQDAVVGRYIKAVIREMEIFWASRQDVKRLIRSTSAAALRACCRRILSGKF